MADVIADLLARIQARLAEQGIQVSLGDIEHQVRLEWGGRENWVLRGQSPERAMRDSQIREALLRGESAQSVGRRFGLSPRQVRRIVRQFI